MVGEAQDVKFVGDADEVVDHAIRAVLDSVSRFNRTAIQVMRMAISQSSPLSLQSILQATNTMRRDVLSCLTQLFQRLGASNQIPRNLNRSYDPTQASNSASTSVSRAGLLGLHEHDSALYAAFDTASALSASLELDSLTGQGRGSSALELRERLGLLRESQATHAMELDLVNLDSARLSEAQCCSLRGSSIAV
jgi:hypothetical protein